jgi:predicted choloylglycine hydrolase
MERFVNVHKSLYSGNHYEMGFQQGKQHCQSIHRVINVLLESDVITENKPSLLPRKIFFTFAKQRAKKLLKKDIINIYPKQAQRLKGIADGASTGLSSILFIQMTELLVGCTALAFSSKKFSTAEPIIAKNFDYLNLAKPFNLVCESQPNEGYKTLSCRFTPTPGTFDGMNEYGLAVTYNLAQSTDHPDVYVPTSIMLQEMLETCRNTQEAVDFVLNAKRGGHDALLTIVDPTDDIKTLEISSKHAAVREPEDGYVVNTNHYRTKEMQKVSEATTESSIERLNRAEEILHNVRKPTEKAIINLLADHGKDNISSNLTICRCSGYGSTLRSTLFYPKTRSAKVLFGLPCENTYTQVSFS